MTETWKPHPWYTHYEVSDRGGVRSIDRVVQTRSGPRKYKGKPLKQGKYGRYPLMTWLTRDHVQYQECVHRLVLEVFVGPAPKDHVGSHRDGDLNNNNLENLYWRPRKAKI